MTATVTTLQVNTSLLRLVLKHIEMHPNQWEQEVPPLPKARLPSRGGTSPPRLG